MATIPRAALDYLTKQINACSADAQAKALKLLEQIDWSDVAAARQIVVEAINIIVAEYGLASAQAAADFYDASRELCTGEKLGAKAYTDIDPKATEGAIRAFVNKIVKHDDVEGFNRATCSRIDYEMKRSAGYCMTQNGAKDPLKPKYARVPSGAETCKFCLMLASRGFVYHSKKSAGALDHYHDGCDCRIVCSWDDDGVEGYDPDACYHEWIGRENFSIPESKLTSYALNMDHPKGRDKAIAFRGALGFTSDDAAEIMSQVYRWVGAHDPVLRQSDQYGDRYTTDMEMVGKSGKTARVTVGWIKDHGSDKMRMTSIYVSKRKG